MVNKVPPFLGEWIDQGRDDVALPVAQPLMSIDTEARWALLRRF